jgi:O-antigen/teichoic acid export membrane protein
MIKKMLQDTISRLQRGKELSALVDQALVSGSNFLTNVILARALGVSEYGVFALSWTCVLFANSLQWAFVVTPMMSVGPKQDEGDRPGYFGAVLLQEVVFAGLSALAVFCGVILVNIYIPQWNLKHLSFPLAFATVSYQVQDFLRRYFFSVRSSKRALVCDAVSYLTQLPIILVLTRLPYFSVSLALWIIGTTSLGGFAVAFRWFERCSLDLVTLKRTCIRHWKISRWIAPSAFMQWSSGNLFAMAAPIYYGTAAAGILRASQNIVGVAHIWFLGLDNVVPAEAARIMHLSGVDASFAYIKRVLFRWGLITLIFVSVIAAFPTFWLHLTYGDKYTSYGYVLQLYAAMYAVVFLAGPLRAALQALEYTAPIFWSYSAMTVFSILAAGPFAKRLGLTGAILGMIATQVIFQSVVGISLLLRVRKSTAPVMVDQNL